MNQRQSEFPSHESGLNYAFSDEPILLNGMKIIFDQSTSVYPVNLQLKNEHEFKHLLVNSLSHNRNFSQQQDHIFKYDREWLTNPTRGGTPGLVAKTKDSLYNQILTLLDQYHGIIKRSSDQTSKSILEEVIDKIHAWNISKAGADINKKDRRRALHELETQAQKFLEEKIDLEDLSHDKRQTCIECMRIISGDSRFIEIREVLTKGKLSRLRSALQKKKTYFKLLPVLGLIQTYRETNKAQHQKNRAKNLLNLAIGYDNPLLQTIALHLNAHYENKRNKRIVSGIVSVAALPINFLLPGAGAGLGAGIGATADIGGKVLLDETVDTVVSIAGKQVIEKGGQKAASKVESSGRADDEEQVKYNIETIRALILYLGLPINQDVIEFDKKEEENFEYARSFLKKQLNSDPEEDLYEIVSTETDENRYKLLKESSQKQVSDNRDVRNYQLLLSDESLFVEDETDFLRLLWMMEGYLKRLNHGSKPKKQPLDGIAIV